MNFLKTIKGGTSTHKRRLGIFGLLAVFGVSTILGLISPFMTMEAQAAPSPGIKWRSGTTVELESVSPKTQKMKTDGGDTIEVNLGSTVGTYKRIQASSLGLRSSILVETAWNKLGDDRTSKEALTGDEGVGVFSFKSSTGSCESIILATQTVAIYIPNPYISSKNKCLDDLIDFKNKSGDDATYVNDFFVKSSVTGGELANSLFTYNTETDVVKVSTHPEDEFVKSDTENMYLRKSEEGERCRDRIVINKDTKTAVFYEARKSQIKTAALRFGEDPVPSGLGFESDCVLVTQAQSGTLAIGTSAEIADIIDSNLDAGGDDKIEQDCEFKKGGLFDVQKWASGALDWFGCTVAKALISIVDVVTEALEKILKTENMTTNEKVKEVWGNFLTIANILFVIAFLIMVISTSLDLGIFDAYTVKKLLPRILIAVILANLSLTITSIAIDITNAMGNSVKDIILSAVKTPPPSSGANGSPDVGAATGLAIASGISVAVVAMVSAVSAGSVFVLVPALLSAVFALIVGFTVVVIRRIIILLLVILAPLAIVLWVIPGSEGWAKRWWKTLLQMLMIYPIIMAMLASGRFVSELLLKTSGPNPGFFEGLAALLALVLPLFMLPAVFKMASSTLSNVTGMINDRSKGIVDRGKNWGKEKASQTDNALTKKSMKDDKLRLRGDRQRGVALDRLANRGGVRGWSSRRGLGEQEENILSSEIQKHRVRRQAAEVEGWKAEQQGMQLDMAASQYDVPETLSHVLDEDGNRTGTTYRHDQKDDILTALARGQRLEVERMGANGLPEHTAELDGTQRGMSSAAMQTLAGLGRDGTIRTLRNTGNIANANVNQGDLQSAVRDNATSLVGKAPDLIKPAQAAFDTGMSGATLKSFSGGTVTEARRYAQNQAATGDYGARNKLVAAATELTTTPNHFVDLSAGTAEQLHTELTALGGVDQTVLDALETKF